MDYIKFSQPTRTGDLLNIIDKLSIGYNHVQITDTIIEGISNGLFRIDRTLCFIEKISNRGQLAGLEQAMILTNSEYSDELKDYNIVFVEDSRFILIRLLEYFVEQKSFKSFSSEIDYPDQFISEKANIHSSAIIEDNVVIEDHVTISAGCVIKNGTVVRQHAVIRENCSIGCDGIALYKAKNGNVYRFPHVAGVHIGNNVELGANCVVARGTLSNTKISDHTVIGNLSNIGHGVKIGKKAWISVGAMIGGNCTIEDRATIGLGVSLKDNLFIASGSTIGMGSVVTKSLKETANVFGNPAKPVRPLRVGPNR